MTKPKKLTPKKQASPGAPVGNKNNEIYTLTKTLSLFNSALKILNNDEDIFTETALMVKCKYELSLPMSSYLYLRDDKFPIDLEDIKREINSILESRVMKSKEMYPGIAAMTLKNKHKWRDQQDINQNITLPPGLKILFDAET